MAEEIIIKDLMDFISFVLNYDDLSFVEMTFNKLKGDLGLVGVPPEKTDELDSRVWYKQYLEFIRFQFEENHKKSKRLDSSGFNSPAIISNAKYYFRGQYDSSKGLRTSIYRNDKYKYEDDIYHEMLVRCTEEFRNTTHLEKLSIMQHYGCPTRLLDITSNPLVALYFACKNFGCEKCDTVDEGIVYIFLVEPSDMVYSNSDKALIRSCLPRFRYEEKDRLIKIASENLMSGEFPKNNGVYEDEVIERLYHEICRELPAFERKMRPYDLLQPIFIQPDKTNQRILKQDGAFILSGLSYDEYEEQGKLELLPNVSIKVKNKERILEQLERIGINEASLFPEMEHVARYLIQSI